MVSCNKNCNNKKRHAFLVLGHEILIQQLIKKNSMKFLKDNENETYFEYFKMKCLSYLWYQNNKA